MSACEFCASTDTWCRTHCYRCDTPMADIGVKYRLCVACLGALGLDAEPIEPDVYWRAREDFGATKE